MKSFALSMPKEERREFANKGAYRIISLEATDCWYGFIYTRNESVHNIKEEITPKIEGLEVMGR